MAESFSLAHDVGHDARLWRHQLHSMALYVMDAELPRSRTPRERCEDWRNRDHSLFLRCCGHVTQRRYRGLSRATWNRPDHQPQNSSGYRDDLFCDMYLVGAIY